MTAIVMLGASGLIGSQVLPLLLQRAEHSADSIISLGRRPLALNRPCLQQLTLALDTPDGLNRAAAALQAAAPLRALLCTFGTTLAQAGSRAAFTAIDRDLPLRYARLAAELGAERLLLVSSVGADPASHNFYLRNKGDLEQAVQALGFRRCDLLRPGLLLGQRQGDRPAERWGQRLAPWANRALLGPLRRYRAIEAADVAAAMVGLLEQAAAGVHVHHYDALIRLASLRLP